jgi:hypothetical protein
VVYKVNISKIEQRERRQAEIETGSRENRFSSNNSSYSNNNNNNSNINLNNKFKS